MKLGTKKHSPVVKPIAVVDRQAGWTLQSLRKYKYRKAARAQEIFCEERRMRRYNEIAEKDGFCQAVRIAFAETCVQPETWMVLHQILARKTP